MNVGQVLPRRSWIEVEVLDAATNEVVGGFERGSCKPLHTDSVCAAVSWNDTRGLPANKKLKLRFHLMGAARLYSFGFQEAI